MRGKNKNRRFIYVDDSSTDAYLVWRQMQKMNVQVNWLPFKRCLEYFDAGFLNQFDFVLLDYHGTTLEGISEEYKNKNIETVLCSSAPHLKFRFCEFIPKDDLSEYLKGRYNEQ